MSSSRDAILAAVRASQPDELPLPTVPLYGGDASVERFTEVLRSIGGEIMRLPDHAAIPAVIQQLFPVLGPLASTLLPATVAVAADTPVATLDAVDVAVLQGEFGVAENGAVWVPETNMLHRALPFITQHLILVLEEKQLVATMHEAYARLPSPDGYGVFIAGPSKTADIEQSLVIGAHGARSLVVLLIAG